MVGGTRRSHTKTRNGCGQCKAKHIRCNLQAPVCQNCERKGLSCDYLQLGSQPQAPDQQTSIAIRDQRQHQQDGRPKFSTGRFRIDQGKRLTNGVAGDVRGVTYVPASPWATIDPPGRDRLITHWLDFTANSIPLMDESVKTNIWNQGIALTPLVREKTYVVEALRCIALLHINYLQSSSGSASTLINPDSTPKPLVAPTEPGIGPSPSQKDGVMGVFGAYKHLGNALAIFRTEVSGINRNNVAACVAFVLAVMVCNLDIARRAPPDDFQTIILDPFRALRNAWTLRSALIPLFHGSTLESLGTLEARQRLEEAAANEGAGLGQDVLQSTMENIESLLRRTEVLTGEKVDVPDVRYENYRDFMLGLADDRQPLGKDWDCRTLAIIMLRTWARNIEARPSTWVDLVFWPGCIPTDFLSLLAAKDSAALTILVYWIVIASRTSKRWFLDGWARRGAAVAMRYVSAEWEEYMSWPIAQLGLEMAVRPENPSRN